MPEDKVNVEVAFEHKGPDGKVRLPGSKVTMSAEEAAVRQRDGFVVPPSGKQAGSTSSTAQPSGS